MIIAIPTDAPALDVAIDAPTGERPSREVALVSVVLPDGREARFHVSVHVDNRGALHVDVESKRMWRGKPTRCSLVLSAQDYTNPETGAPSRFVAALKEIP